MSQTSDSCSTGKPTETWNSSFNAAVYCMQASLRTWNISNSGYHTLRTLVFSQPPQISSWHDHCFQRLLWPYRMCSANLRLETSQPLTHIFENHPQGYLWHFSDECHSMFEALRKAFTTAPALMHCTSDTQSQSRLTPLTTHMPQSFWSWLQMAITHIEFQLLTPMRCSALWIDLVTNHWNHNIIHQPNPCIFTSTSGPNELSRPWDVYLKEGNSDSVS